MSKQLTDDARAAIKGAGEQTRGPRHRQKTYDPACYDLAETFLSDEPGMWTKGHCEKLAAVIQGAIEDYIGSEKPNIEPPDPPGFEGGFADNH